MNQGLELTVIINIFTSNIIADYIHFISNGALTILIKNGASTTFI